MELLDMGRLRVEVEGIGGRPSRTVGKFDARRRPCAGPRSAFRAAATQSTAVVLIAASTLPAGAQDTRQRVELPAPMEAHTLAKMREHLRALGTITRHLAGAQYEAAYDTAETRLGMSAMHAHGAAHMGCPSCPSRCARSAPPCTMRPANSLSAHGTRRSPVTWALPSVPYRR